MSATRRRDGVRQLGDQDVSRMLGEWVHSSGVGPWTRTVAANAAVLDTPMGVTEWVLPEVLGMAPGRMVQHLYATAAALSSRRSR
jgi:hypothetical protein